LLISTDIPPIDALNLNGSGRWRGVAVSLLGSTDAKVEREKGEGPQKSGAF